MIIIISGASHTGKTVLAQKLLEKYNCPYLSEDLLKMGLIRSGHTKLTPVQDREMTTYLWGIVKEIIKTAVENEQNLIVEGCYVPFNWKKDFGEEYLPHIKAYFLVMTENYIRNKFPLIKEHASDIEKRLDDSFCTAEWLIAENRFYLEGARKYGCVIIMLDEEYSIDI